MVDVERWYFALCVISDASRGTFAGGLAAGGPEEEIYGYGEGGHEVSWREREQDAEDRVRWRPTTRRGGDPWGGRTSCSPSTTI